MLLKREPWISTSTLSDWILIHRKDGLQEHFKAFFRFRIIKSVSAPWWFIESQIQILTCLVRQYVWNVKVYKESSVVDKFNSVASDIDVLHFYSISFL